MQDSIYHKFLELLVAKVKALDIGNGFDDTVAGGPLVTYVAISISCLLSGM